MKCQFSGLLQTITPLHRFTKVISKYEEVQEVIEQAKTQLKTIEKLKDSFRVKEIRLLRNLIEIPRQVDPVNKARICSYEEILLPVSDASENDAF